MKHTKIADLRTILESLTAFGYAQAALDHERKTYSVTTLNTGTGKVSELRPSYEEYMRQVWHNRPDATLQDCIDNSFASKVQDYGKLCQQFNDWTLGGKMFLLDTEQAVVYFIGRTTRDKGEPAWVESFVNHNPRDVDVISHSTRHSEFVERINAGTYDIGSDEAALIAKCDALIAERKMEMAVSKWD